MFPSLKTRFRGGRSGWGAAFWHGADRAVEFATLGEYGLLEAVSAPAESAPPVPPQRQSVRPSRLRPATAAARRLQPPTPARVRVTPHAAMRSLALDGAPQ